MFNSVCIFCYRKSTKVYTVPSVSTVLLCDRPCNVGCIAYCTSVYPSFCPVLASNLRTKSSKKPKIDRKIAQVTCNSSWTSFGIRDWIQKAMYYSQKKCAMTTKRKAFQSENLMQVWSTQSVVSIKHSTAESQSSEFNFTGQPIAVHLILTSGLL